LQLGHFEGFGGQINAQHLRAFACHGIGQDAATAANVQHFALYSLLMNHYCLKQSTAQQVNWAF
jgi:hypothetical protein